MWPRLWPDGQLGLGGGEPPWGRVWTLPLWGWEGSQGHTRSDLSRRLGVTTRKSAGLIRFKFLPTVRKCNGRMESEKAKVKRTVETEIGKEGASGRKE